MSKVRIGLIGVPGSGKSRFAAALKRALPEYNFAVVDNYVEKLQQKLEMTAGVESTYLPNMHIASHREQEIRKLCLEDKNFIVCGTMFDTLCYTGFHAEIVANASGERNEKDGVLMRELAAAQTFAYMTIDSSISFTHFFYLPITDPDLLVAIASKDDENALPRDMEIFDKTIQDALRRYGSPATVLKNKHSKNVQQAIETIKSGNDGRNDETPVAGE